MQWWVSGALAFSVAGGALAQSPLLDFKSEKESPIDMMGALLDANNFVSVKTLREYCFASVDDRARSGLCLGYILGAADALSSSLAFQKNTKGVDQSKIEGCFSIPESTSSGQIKDVVVKRLKEVADNDMDKTFPASWPVIYALKRAFPCR